MQLLWLHVLNHIVYLERLSDVLVPVIDCSEALIATAVSLLGTVVGPVCIVEASFFDVPVDVFPVVVVAVGAELAQPQWSIVGFT